MNYIKSGKVLILSDLHQDIGYAKTVLEKETDWDHIIFNGDYFDTFKTPDGAVIYGITQTCLWVNEMFEDLGDRATWHTGNHDCAYLASYRRDYTKTRPNQYYNCSGWSKNKAKYFNKEINPKWIDNLKLCTRLGDNTIVSHAGFHYRHFKPHLSEMDNIKSYYDSWEKEKHTFHIEPWHWIWDVGRSRGGMAIVGSPIWMDWDEEFVPIDGVKQIVGHSTDPNGARCKSNGIGLENWCIDGMQTTYAVWENEKIEVKHISGKQLVNLNDHQTYRVD